MGFCRYCGEIVLSQARCDCGGPATQSTTFKGFMKEDRWSKTYVSNESKPTPPAPPSPPKPAQRRFPRPLSSVESARPKPGMSDDITTQISSRSRILRGTSPTKAIQPLPEAGILPAFSPNGHSDAPSLTKVYGSLLSNNKHTEFCDECQTPFVAEDTLYPRVQSTGTLVNTFLCKECFVSHGGTRGSCGGCHKPVLILKAEGGFIEIGDNVYHRRCFVCTGCGENASQNPMVDLLGRPCCTRPECFDTCLTRKTPVRHEPGDVTPGRRASQALEELSNRLSSIDSRSPPSKRLDTSPRRSEQRPSTHSSRPSIDAIEEMKRRFMPKEETPDLKGLNIDLGSSFSSTVSESPLTDIPLRQTFVSSPGKDFVATAANPDPIVPSSDRRTSRARSVGRDTFERHPSPPSFANTPSAISLKASISTSSPRTSSRYDPPPELSAEESSEGVKPVPYRPLSMMKANSASSCLPSSLSFSRPLTRNDSPPGDESPRSPAFTPAPNKCPGCNKAAFPMERGVVTGPHATRWHSACLVCASTGCTKQLDSSAKRDAEGKVRCRNCWLSLPQNLRSSPARPVSMSAVSATNSTPFRPGSPVKPSQTTLIRQMTGEARSISPTKQAGFASTVARPALHTLNTLTRQRTGEGRSVSPTKQLGLGTRKRHMPAKSMDEGMGRGVFLVRQMTGLKN